MATEIERILIDEMEIERESALKYAKAFSEKHIVRRKQLMEIEEAELKAEFKITDFGDLLSFRAFRKLAIAKELARSSEWLRNKMNMDKETFEAWEMARDLPDTYSGIQEIK